MGLCLFMSPPYYLFIPNKLEFLLHSKKFWLQAIKLKNLYIKINFTAGVQYQSFLDFFKSKTWWSQKY